jgi:pimeloyl-ACP methyl ester carboxylesterase
MAEVVARGVRFHVQRLGRGERTVVFLHGLVIDNLSSWYFSVAAPLSRHAQVLLYDLRGHGKSDQPPTGYGLGDMVADLVAILDALDLRDPVTLVGNSFGGMLALAFARDHPVRVRDLVLVDGHVGHTGWAEQMAETLSLKGEARERKIRELFENAVHVDRGPLAAEAEAVVRKYERGRGRARDRFTQVAEALLERTTFVADVRSTPPLADHDLRAVLCPVLALYGEDSDVRAHGERLARVLPQCELVLFPGCGHSLLWQATRPLREALVRWIARR